MIRQSKHGWIKAVRPSGRQSGKQILAPILDHVIETAESALAASDPHLIVSGFIAHAIKSPNLDTRDWLNLAGNNADPGIISARNLGFKALAETLSVKLAWSDLQHAARSAPNTTEILNLAEQLARHVYLATAHSRTIPIVSLEADIVRGRKNLKQLRQNGSDTKNLKRGGYTDQHATWKADYERMLQESRHQGPRKRVKIAIAIQKQHNLPDSAVQTIRKVISRWELEKGGN